MQISDSHIGFNKAANADVTATHAGRGRERSTRCQLHPRSCCTPATSASSRSLRVRHRGSSAAPKRARSDVFFVPGEHDVGTDNGAQYLERYGKTHTARRRSRRLVQLRPQRRALHRSRQRLRSQSRRTRRARQGHSSSGSRRTSKHLVAQHADRRVRARAAVDRVSRVGLGNRRRRAGAVVPEDDSAR